MTLFHGIYKCRLCGECFESVATGSKDTALKSVAGAAYDGKWYPEVVELVYTYTIFTPVKMEVLA